MARHLIDRQVGDNWSQRDRNHARSHPRRRTSPSQANRRQYRRTSARMNKRVENNTEQHTLDCTVVDTSPFSLLTTSIISGRSSAFCAQLQTRMSEETIDVKRLQSYHCLITESTTLSMTLLPKLGRSPMHTLSAASTLAVSPHGKSPVTSSTSSMANACNTL